MYASDNPEAFSVATPSPGSASIDWGTDTLTSAGAGDGYVLSLDADGNYLWAGRFGGVGTGSANGDGDFVNTIAVDGSGNTYVGGVIYQGSGPAVDVQFGTGSTTVTGSGQPTEPDMPALT